MTKDGQRMASWTGQGVGRFTGPGKVSFRGALYFRTPSAKQRLIQLVMIPAFAALWFTTTWYVFIFSLPFSNGENFQFNLNPSIAAIIGIVALPLLGSMIFLTASKL